MDRRLLLDFSFWSAVKGMLAVTVTSYFFFKLKQYVILNMVLSVMLSYILQS